MNAATLTRPPKKLLLGRLPDFHFGVSTPPVKAEPTFPDAPPLVRRDRRPAAHADHRGGW